MQVYQNKTLWEENIRELQQTHPAWNKRPDEARSYDAAASWLQDVRYSIATSYGEHTFLHQHDSLKPMVQAIFVQKGFSVRLEFAAVMLPDAKCTAPPFAIQRILQRLWACMGL